MRVLPATAELATLEARAEIDGLVKGANFAERASERFYRRHLTSYFAAALMMRRRTCCPGLAVITSGSVGGRPLIRK